jgi:hypothetical protein
MTRNPGRRAGHEHRPRPGPSQSQLHATDALSHADVAESTRLTCCGSIFCARDQKSRFTERFGPSYGALVRVAPSRVWVLEQDDDGMVSFFVVCFGVLAGGVIGARDPPAGLAQAEPDPGVPAVQARPAAACRRRGRVDGGSVLAWARASTVALILTCWHRSLGSGHGGEVARPMQRFPASFGNGQRERRSSAGVITRAGSGARRWSCSEGGQVLCWEERCGGWG